MKMSFDSGTDFGDVTVTGITSNPENRIAIEQPSDDGDGSDTVIVTAGRVDYLIAALTAVKATLAEGAPRP